MHLFAIRLINLESRTVETLIGTGVQGHDMEGGKSGLQQAISSPWDLCLGHSFGKIKTEGDLEPFDTIYIAMAGTHQVKNI